MRITCLIIFLLAAVRLPAQQILTPVFDTITVSYQLWETPYPSAAYARDTSRDDYNLSLTGNWLSFAGHAQAATEAMDIHARVMGMDTARFENFRDNFRPVPALPALLKDAAEHEIVIINEAHHEPRHRVFTRQLLQGLYDRGYRHFGLETLAAHASVDSLLATGHYFPLNGGYYTRDPGFAAMVVAAKSIGFTVFGYESMGHDGPRARELGQMRNIMAYRQDHPEGKYLLHVGYSHANEGVLGGRWEKAMAQRLADTTGLNPLTINQTHFREMSRRELERYEYQSSAVSAPSVYINKSGESWNFNDEVRWFDRYVFHPRTVYRYGRPDYVFAHGQVPVQIDLAHLTVPGPYVLQAYGVDDDIAVVVPRDVVEISKKAAPVLALAPGAYRLLVTAAGGEQFVGKIMVR